MDYKEKYETIMTTIKAFFDTLENLQEEQKKEILEGFNISKFVNATDAQTKINRNQNNFLETLKMFLNDYENGK